MHIELSEWVTVQILCFAMKIEAMELIIKWGAFSSTLSVPFHLIILASSNFPFLLQELTKENKC
jgi:hypothetical protein